MSDKNMPLESKQLDAQHLRGYYPCVAGRSAEQLLSKRHFLASELGMRGVGGDNCTGWIRG
jgi:hypothetical protein